MSRFSHLIDLKGSSLVRMEAGDGQLAVAPDMGARVFARIGGLCPHRIDLEMVRNPVVSGFRNYGGNNFWPAPEGGPYGFNYQGDTWYVQPAINSQPFEVAAARSDAIELVKHAVLTNRAGHPLDVRMRRKVSVACEKPPAIAELSPAIWLSYRTVDSFELARPVSTDQVIIAAWSLEQFNASDSTVSFCHGPTSSAGVNFDFYQPEPHERIAYGPEGFIYRTDGRSRGQIGIRCSARAQYIGFADTATGVVCMKENCSPESGLYFNIADNAQPNGPYSAQDRYSIFNSDSDMAAFELETVGSARVIDSMLHGSELTSTTTLAIVDDPRRLAHFLKRFGYSA